MIEVCELAKRYGPIVAVDGLTFAVAPGKVTGFLGPNGAGKSTTMRIILGLDAADSGQALVYDQPYRRLARPLRAVGALLDAEAVHGGRTASRHVAAIARSNGIGRARVAEVLGQVGLDSVAGRRVQGFSLGMKQRLGIAVALLGDPPVLMFDEPVNGLDPEGIRWIRQLMRSLAAEGRTVFVASHLMSEMALTADQVIVIGRGRLIADVPVSDLTRSVPGGDVLVRCSRGTDLASLLRRSGAIAQPVAGGGLAVTGMAAAAIAAVAASAGIAVHELTPRHISLEEAFMELTGDSAEYRAGPPARPGHDARAAQDS